MRFPRTRVLLAGPLLALASLGGAVDAGLALTDAWVREAPSGARVLAGYLTLENTGDRRHRIVAASSPQFARVELHRSVVVDDVARMEPQPYFEIPLGGRLAMEPGGDHLMLFDPVPRLAAGMLVELTVEFDDGSSGAYVLEVRRADGVQREHHRHHHHH